MGMMDQIWDSDKWEMKKVAGWEYLLVGDNDSSRLIL